MELTARHINEKQFNDAWRGYNQREVDDFLDRVAEQMNRLEAETAALQARLRELDQMVEANRSTEDMLKKTLVTAQRAAEQAIASAKSKAEALVAEAESRVERANDELKQRVATAEEEVRRKTAEVERQHLARRREAQESVERLEGIEGDIKRRLKAFLEQQLNALDRLVDTPAASPASPTRAPERQAATAREAQEQPTGAAPGSQQRLHATPSPRLEQHTEPAGRADTEPQRAVAATNDPGYEGFSRDDELEDFVNSDNGDASRRRPLREIFRRENRDEDWSQEDA